MSNQTPRTVPEVIAAARIAQKLTLEEFARAVGANSKQNIFNWEKGASEPGREIIDAWFSDARPWLSQLAEDIFVARYRQSLQAFASRNRNTSIPA